MSQLLQKQFCGKVESKRRKECDHVNERWTSGFEATRTFLDVLLAMLQTHVTPCPANSTLKTFSTSVLSSQNQSDTNVTSSMPNIVFTTSFNDVTVVFNTSSVYSWQIVNMMERIVDVHWFL